MARVASIFLIRPLVVLVRLVGVSRRCHARQNRPLREKLALFVANPPGLSKDMILADGVLMDIHPRAQLDFWRHSKRRGVG